MRTLLALAFFLQGPPRADIKTTVPLVLAPVTVTTGDGKPVHDLNAEDFVVYDGNQVRPHQLEVTTQPVSVIFLVQTSRNAGPALAKVPKIASMILPLIAGEGGSAALISFSDRVTVKHPFTSDAASLQQAFHALRPDGEGGRMLDAVQTAADLFRQQSNESRRVIIMIGESRDRGSEMSLTGAIEQAVRSNATIYPINFSTTWTAFTSKGSEHFGEKKNWDKEPAVYQPGAGFNAIAALVELSRMGTENSSEVMARSTGGLKLSFLRLSGLESVVAKIGDDLHMQYLLSFQPAPVVEPAYREIRVALRTRTGLTLRARPGYWAQP